MNKLKTFFLELGEFFHFSFIAIKYFPSNIKKPKEVFRNIWSIGVKSFVIVSLTGLFTGMILGLQLGEAMEDFIRGTSQFVGAALSIAVIRELGPVLTALIVTSRVCSSVTAQLGTMRVTEQIDALKTLSVEPMEYLVAPRVMAGMISLPILSAISSFFSIFGGYMMIVFVQDVPSSTFLMYSRLPLQVLYVFEAFTKSFIIGMMLLLISTFYGFNTKGGADGVGKSVIKSVVVSSFMVILMDYVLGSLFILFF